MLTVYLIRSANKTSDQTRYIGTFETMSAHGVRNVESLPKQFVSAMHTLFEIMDDKRTGYVKLTDIENRWRDDRTKGLPRGVIESLQKVASADGLLTFDRFCTGLKICLIKNQIGDTTNNIINCREENVELNRSKHKLDTANRPPSASIINIQEEVKGKEIYFDEVNYCDQKQQRTISMPLIIGDQDLDSHHGMQSENLKPVSRSYGPPKPPRLEKRNIEVRSISKTENELNFEYVSESNGLIEDTLRSNEQQGRGNGDGRPAADVVQSSRDNRRHTKRREPRRHTLHNGIDYNLLKRMKQIEQEKDVLLQGLAAVEHAREWYLRQLAEVQERMRYAGRMGAYVEPWNEAQQERLELLKARVLELNRQLGALAAGWRHGSLSLHMNLALPNPPIMNAINNEPNHASILTTQNRMLVEEVNKKKDRINVLEREKSSLIRELLLQNNRKKSMEPYD